MVLRIESPEVDQLAQELADLTGEPLERVVTTALRNHLERERDVARRMEAIRQIQERVAKLPILDHRSADEILGYDENGLPT